MQLMAVTDGSQPVKELAQKIIEVAPYVDWIQIREKTKTTEELATLLAEVEVSAVPKDRLILNSEVELAARNSISIVHLPENGLTVAEVKARFPQLRIGRSVHSVVGALEAERQGADYVQYGHCFLTDCKRGKAPNGLGPLEEMKRQLTIPIIAIGGIQVERVPKLAALQVDGVAVMSGIFSARQPAVEAQRLKEAVQCASKL